MCVNNFVENFKIQSIHYHKETIMFVHLLKLQAAARIER